MNADTRSFQPVSDYRTVTPSRWYAEAMEHLVNVVQALSLARDLQGIMDIVRRAARELTGAEGSTFVLREGDECFYAEEDAIGPLWKGLRFPLSTCISGWAMLNREAAIVQDIFEDPRIPIDAYQPTFVRSLAMVPIRRIDPIGAIGNYWAQVHQPTPEQMKVLQALADVTAVAMENVQVLTNLERLVKERTADLKAANDRLQREVELRKEAEDAARRQSLTDELTGLYNRRGFLLFATQQFQLACRANEPGWLLFADADGLKAVNDRDGHEAGDRTLLGVTAALRRCFSELDVISRLGGDEFVVYTTGRDHQATALRERLLGAVDDVNRSEGLSISLSIGIARCEPDPTVPFDEHLRVADNAMYSDKQAKRADTAVSPIVRPGRFDR